MYQKIINTLGVLSIGFVFMLSGCKGREQGSLPSGPAVKVESFLVAAKTEAAIEEVSGTVRPRDHATIEAKVSGRVEKMYVAEGQSVTEGQVLAQLEVRELQARLDQATAANEEARRELKRFTVLTQQNATSRAELEAAQAKAHIAEAAVIETQAMLEYAKVTAPFAGVVTRKISNVGDLAAPGRALFELEDPTILRLEANVPEALIGNVKVGQQFIVSVSSVSQALKGRVVEVSPTADPNSRTYLVKLTLESSAQLRSGQFGRVGIPALQEVTLRVPTSALVKRGQLEYVLVIENGRAWLRLVRSGRQYQESIEILAGVEGGEQIVAKEAERLVDGSMIEVIS